MNPFVSYYVSETFREKRTIGPCCQHRAQSMSLWDPSVLTLTNVIKIGTVNPLLFEFWQEDRCGESGDL